MACFWPFWHRQLYGGTLLIQGNFCPQPLVSGRPKNATFRTFIAHSAPWQCPVFVSCLLLPLLKTFMPIVRGAAAGVRSLCFPTKHAWLGSIHRNWHSAIPHGAYNGFLITNTHQVDDNVINIKGLFQNRSNVMMNVIWELKTANMPKIWFFMEWIQQNVPWLMPIKMASTRLVDKHLIFWVDFQKKKIVEKSENKKVQFILPTFNFGRTNWPSFFDFPTFSLN